LLFMFNTGHPGSRHVRVKPTSAYPGEMTLDLVRAPL
jgi:hypothetical protein